MSISSVTPSFLSLLNNRSFLLAKLYFESLMDTTSKSELLSALGDIKQKSQNSSISALFDDAFRQIMQRIYSKPYHHKDLAVKALSWVALAKRPLRIEELRHALAVKPNDESLDMDNVRDIKIITTVCAGFLIADETTSSVELIHPTAHTFLETAKDKWLPMADTYMANICLTYLSFKAFESSRAQNDQELEDRLRKNPVYDYTAHHWGDHARNAVGIHQQITTFLHSEDKFNASTQVLLTVKRWPNDRGYSQRLPINMTALHLAAYFGILSYIRTQIKNGSDKWVNEWAGKTADWEPMWWAAKNGHASAVRLLLEELALSKVPIHITAAPTPTSRNNMLVSSIHYLLCSKADLLCYVDWLGRETERTGLFSDLSWTVKTIQTLLGYSQIDFRRRQKLQEKLGHWGIQMYSRTGADGDLEEAFTAAQELIATTPPGDPDTAQRLALFGRILGEKYLKYRDRSYLEDCIKTVQRAIRMARREDEQLPTWLNYLGAQLGLRYMEVGDISSLDSSISLIEEAIEMTPADSPDRRKWIRNLTEQLNHRYEVIGAKADLYEPLKEAEKAIKTASGEPQELARCMNHLGSLLGEKYSKTGVRSDIDNAIECVRKAISTVSEKHQDYASYLNNLAIQLERRAAKAGGPVDLEEAIAVIRLALCKSQGNHPEHARYLTTSGSLLNSRFSRLGTIGDLDEAIENTILAAELSPRTQPERAVRLNQIGTLLQRRYLRLGNQSDLDNAKRCYIESLNLECAPTSVRVEAGQYLLSASDVFQDCDEAFKIAEIVILLIAKLPHRSLSIYEQEKLLRTTSALASNAAAIALQAGKSPVTALEWIETGIDLLAREIDDTIELSKLSREHPRLAEDFAELRNQLEVAASRRNNPRVTDLPGASISAGTQFEANRRLDDLKGQIRAKEGFTRFLLSPSESDIFEAAAPGPIVVLNYSVHRCDAIIIQTSGISHLELPRLYIDDIPIRYRTKKSLAWLWDTIVQPILHFLGFTQPDENNWPHIWWVPTGPLFGLPLHAAGKYQDDDKGQLAIDLVVSSYGRSIKRIIQARSWGQICSELTSSPPGKGNLVAIGMCYTPGAPSLPCVHKELQMVKEYCRRLDMSCVKPRARKREVLSALKNSCAIFHFAGHGSQTATTTLDQYLLLEDWKEDPLTAASIISCRETSIRNLEAGGRFLAFLSACSQPAWDTREIPGAENGLDIIFGFQVMGFSHVIGHIGLVADEAANAIASLVYEFLSDKGLQDEAVSSALNYAGRSMRDKMRENHENAASGDRSSRHAMLIDEDDDDFEGDFPWVNFFHFGG